MNVRDQEPRKHTSQNRGLGLEAAAQGSLTQSGGAAPNNIRKWPKTPDGEGSTSTWDTELRLTMDTLNESSNVLDSTKDTSTSSGNNDTDSDFEVEQCRAKTLVDSFWDTSNESSNVLDSTKDTSSGNNDTDSSDSEVEAEQCREKPSDLFWDSGNTTANETIAEQTDNMEESEAKDPNLDIEANPTTSENNNRCDDSVILIEKDIPLVIISDTDAERDSPDTTPERDSPDTTPEIRKRKRKYFP